MSAGRSIAGLGMAVASLAALALALALPWYHYVLTTDASTSYEVTAIEDRFYLDDWEREITYPQWTITLEYDSPASQWQAMRDVMVIEQTMMLIVVPLSMAAIVVVLARRRLLSLVLYALAAAALVTMVLYFAWAIPQALTESVPEIENSMVPSSFWGGYSLPPHYVSWGPMLGWFLVLTAAVLELCAFGCVFIPEGKGPVIY